MKRMQALAVILKSFFSLNLGKKTRGFIAKILVYSQVLQLAAVVAIPNPGNLNPYLSTAQSQNPVQIASLPYVGPLSPLLTWAQTGTLPNLSLSSEQLGLSNALSWGVNYSNLTGLFLDAQYILPLSEQFALGLLGEYGPGQYRWNATLGYGFSPLSQMKLSAERLGQRLPFQFDSGNIMQRVHQDAYGLRFQQLFEQPFLQGINVGGYYARAANQNLAPVIFTSNGLNCSASAGLSCINYRSIAGATSTGIDAGTELLLTPSTLLSANVYYDRVNYNTQLTDDISLLARISRALRPLLLGALQLPM